MAVFFFQSKFRNCEKIQLDFRKPLHSIGLRKFDLFSLYFRKGVLLFGKIPRSTPRIPSMRGIFAGLAAVEHSAIAYSNTQPVLLASAIKKMTEELSKNHSPDILARWKQREGKERKNPRTAQSFCVPKADIVAQGYDLSINRYKEVVHEEVEHRPPHEILDELDGIEKEIIKGMKELRGMLK